MSAAGYELSYAAARLAIEEADTTRDRVWGSMVYACTGRKKGDEFDLPPCGHEERYYLGFAVEGPPGLRERVEVVLNAELEAERPFPSDEALERAIRAARVGFIASPFSAGRCPSCYGGSMQHTRFADDETFTELREAPPGARYFRVPDPAAAAYFAHDQGFFGAELVRAPAEAIAA